MLPTPILLAILAAPAAPADVDYGRDVRPILAERCLKCHGAEAPKAGFRLDDRESALRGGDSGASIVAGKGAESELIRRVGLPEGDDEAMPPEGPRLTAEQVATLRGWIDRGASFGDEPGVDPIEKARRHWAFRAPTRPDPPEVRDAARVRSPIDRFVLKRLEAEGLTLSPEADKATLIRRLSLDLIGLPPTIAEVDAFLADESPDAYEKVVDRLLASPHYGERWGRHWLDAARYADSDGYEKDKTRHVWFYRDWVVGALNRDLPYDEFIVEQVAGDQLPDPTQDRRVATGFLRNSVVNEEGGIDPEQFRMEALFDRVEAVGKAVLGLTVQCAQCHNHKFDPISQEEYYRLFAFLNNDDEPALVSYTPDEQMRIAAIHRRIGEVEAGLRESTPGWADRLARWEAETSARPAVAWSPIQGPVVTASDGGQRYMPQADGSFLACGYAPTKHTMTYEAKSPLRTIRAIRIELLNDPNLPGFGPGRSPKGTCGLTEFSAEVVRDGKSTPITLTAATADFEQAAQPLEAMFDDRSGKPRTIGPASFAVDGRQDTAWGMDAGPGRRNVPRQAVFVVDPPVEVAEGATLSIHLAQNHGGWNSDDLQTNNLGRFRVSATDAPGASADPIPPPVRTALAAPKAGRTEAQSALIFGHWRGTVADWKAANDEVEALWRGHPEGATTLVLDARPRMRTTSILRRGDFQRPGRSVGPGVPAVLHPLPEGAPPTRLTLARWLVDPKSPTTARSFVNRAWQAYFGSGLVASAEDLGTQAEPPSHPELLDWLAVEFMGRGWGIKALHRTIVASATYRQSSRVTPELLARDPYNRLLARGARFRVEGEIVRDVQLAASGLLNPALGGPSLMPPAPDHLFQPPSSYAPFPWVEATGPDRYRRALYTWRRRSTPYPLLSTFDVPEGNTSCVRRNRSNTPLQALMTLNEPMAIEAARALARLAISEGGPGDRGRLTYAFRRCVGRPPTAGELDVLAGLLGAQSRRFAEGWADPRPILDAGKGRPQEGPPGGSNPTQWAAYTMVARVLLNLDETITRE